jgi:hypothetical protein
MIYGRLLQRRSMPRIGCRLPDESSSLLFFLFQGVAESHHWGIPLIQKRFFFDDGVTVKNAILSQWPALNFA